MHLMQHCKIAQQLTGNIKVEGVCLCVVQETKKCAGHFAVMFLTNSNDRGSLVSLVAAVL